MTRLVTCGWETGDPNENLAVSDSNFVCATTNPVPKPPSVYCLKGNYSSTSGVYKRWDFAASKTEIYVRFRVFLPGGTDVGNIVFLLDSGASIQFALSWSSSDKLLRVSVAPGTIVSTLPCVENMWHLVELHWKTTTTTSSTDGTVRVWQDGTLVINQTAVDSSITSILNVRSIELLSSGNPYISFDDFAVNDTLGTINNGQIGDGCVVLLKPNGAGSNTAQSRGGTDSGANWSQLEELPPSVADYVYSATVGARDTYALDNLPAGVNVINCCEVVAIGLNSDIGTGSLGLTIKSGATTNEGTAQPLPISPIYLRQLYELDPNTSAAWTVANVNALEAGTTVR